MVGRRRAQTDSADGPYEAHRYMGGYTIPNPDGYILQYAPTHPHCHQSGCIFQHRLVMERKLGRFLKREERVHHIDEDVSNNHPDNLRLYATQADHIHGHHLEDAPCYDADTIELVRAAADDPRVPLWSLGLAPETVRKICRMYDIEWKSAGIAHLTEDQVREALQGRTTEDAAELLGVHQQTLYNKFDHLLDKRRSPGFLDEHREEFCRIAKEKGITAAAEHFGTSRIVAYQALERWGLKDSDYAGKRNLDERREEVLLLIQTLGYKKAAKELGRHENGLREAVKRWKARGDLPDGFAPPFSGHAGQKPQPAHTASPSEPSFL